MTISNTTVEQIYTGNGATVTFAVPFALQANTEIEVTLRDETTASAPTETLQVLTTNYSLTGGPPATNVVMVTAPSATQKLLVRRVTAKTQTADYIGTGPFPAETHETTLDKIVQIAQEQDKKLDRALHLAKSKSLTGLSTELPEPVASTSIGWNSTATGLSNITTTGTLAVTAFGADFVDSSTAAEARTTLDVTRAIASLTVETAPAIGDLIPIRDISEPADNSITLANALKVVDGLTEDTAPAMNDFVLSYDTSATAAKKVSLLTMQGNQFRAVATTDSATSLDSVLSFSGASFTESLFTAVGNTGKRLRFIHAGTSASQVYTIDPNASETIGGSATTTLNSNGEVLDVISNGTNWIILSRYIPSSWVAYTPTFANLGTLTSVSFLSRRVGDSLEIQGIATLGTTAGSACTITLGFDGVSGNVTTAKLPALAGSIYSMVGKAGINNTNTDYTVLASTTDSVLRIGLGGAAASALSSVNGTSLGSSGQVFSLFAKVPISGWNG